MSEGPQQVLTTKVLRRGWLGLTSAQLCRESARRSDGLDRVRLSVESQESCVCVGVCEQPQPDRSLLELEFHHRRQHILRQPAASGARQVVGFPPSCHQLANKPTSA
jgi:hypothetical protein